jgi:hypothetical protein
VLGVLAYTGARIGRGQTPDSRLSESVINACSASEKKGGKDREIPGSHDLVILILRLGPLMILRFGSPPFAALFSFPCER